MYWIFFDLAYAIVEEMLVEETAKRLVPATCGGGRPRNVRTGEIIIPPLSLSWTPKCPQSNRLMQKKEKGKTLPSLIPICSYTIVVT